MPYIDGQVLYAADLESRFAQYLATGGLSALITSMLAQPDAASVRAVLGVGAAILGGTNGQLLYNNSGVQGGVTLGGDATLNASTGVLTIAANVIANSKLALMASTTIKSNITGGAGAATDNTLTAIIDAAISSVQGSFLVRKGTGWSAIGPGTAGQFPVSAGAGADPVMGTWLGGTITNPLTLSAVAINEAKAASITAAATTDIWTGVLGNYVHVTGTTTITSLGTAPQAGTDRTVVFDNALTLTHNATSLILPGSLNISVQAGDVMIVRADTTTNMKVVNYTKASGAAVVVATPADTVNWTTLTRTTDSSIASNVTLASDATLQFSMLANTNYVIEFEFLAVSSGGGVKYGVIGPAAPTRAIFAVIRQNSGGFASPVVGSITQIEAVGAVTASGEHMKSNNCFVLNGVNAATFALQFAQNTSNVTPLIIGAGSWLRYRTF